MERTKTAPASKATDSRRARVKMFETRNDIKPDARQKVVELLNECLAGTFDLYSQTKHAHWNVKGPEFYQLHELYDHLAEMLLPHVDEIAERATALGGVAMGTARMAAASSQLKEYPEAAFGSLQSVAALAEGYAALGKAVREGIDTAEQEEDMVTSDLLTQVAHDLDKGLWFLEAHLQAGER